MNILGIYDGHNASAALVRDGKLLATVEEERFSRVKNHDGRKIELYPPYKSVEFCLNSCRSNIDAIAYALEDPLKLQERAINSFVESYNDGYKNRIKCKEIDGIQLNPFQLYSYPRIYQKKRITRINEYLLKLGINADKIPKYYVNHHLSHASSSYYTSPFENPLIITMDGKGDDLSGLVALESDRKLKTLYEINYLNSIGRLYSIVTLLCGFKPVRHEGKITGLAAYGKANKELINSFKKILRFQEGKWIGSLDKKNKLGPYPHTLSAANIELVRDLVGSINREDLAASIQKHTENEVRSFIDYYLRTTSRSDLVLSGGVFANVKLNQVVYELESVNNIYIHPAMGDSGLGVGAALYVANQLENYPKNVLINSFYGPLYEINDLKKALNKNSLDFYKPKDINVDLAKLLSRGKAIARFEGKLEYGPRSLGNRSIICQASDPSINKSLNSKLKRTEFMPFAPITLAEYFDDCYQNINGASYTSQFMTITFNCTQRMKDQSPAVVHIDGTARPQLVNQKNNPSLHALLSEYYKLTGIPSLINTSFNPHEEPIVCNPEEAIKAFLECNLDCLQLGPFLVLNKNLA